MDRRDKLLLGSIFADKKDCECESLCPDLSADEGNIAECRTDGLYVPAGEAPIEEIPINNLLAADGTNVINNGSFTQEWQFPLISGGTGFKINGTRVADDSVTPEILLDIILNGSVTTASRNRPIKVMSIAAGLINRPRIKVLNLEYTDATFISPHAETSILHINSANVNVPMARIIGPQGEIVFGQGTPTLLYSFNGSGSFSGGMSVNNTSASVAGLIMSSSGNALALEISDFVDAGNPLRANAAFQTVASSSKNAVVSIGPSKLIRASLCIEKGVAPTAPNYGDIWIDADDHLYIRLNGITYQLDQQAGSTFYSADGTLSGTRTVDMATFSLIFNNSGLFRIQDTGSDTGIYDFNEGIDFLVANATKSYSITKDLTNGIKLTSIDNIGTTNDKKEIIIDNTQIKLDSPVLKFDNLPGAGEGLKIDATTNEVSRVAAASASKFTVNVFAGNYASPADSSNAYFASATAAPNTALSTLYINTVLRNCKITGAIVDTFAGTVGTNENWSLYIRVNDTTDYLIETIGASLSRRTFNNNALSITLNAGDFYCLKFVNPAWATNPLSITISGHIEFELV